MPGERYPVFLCLWYGSLIREVMFDVCVTRWDDVAEADPLHVINPASIGCHPTEFQRERRRWPDAHADGRYYVVADDDCLPQAQPFFDEAIDILDRHPDFAILALRPRNSGVSPLALRGHPGFSWEDDEVFEFPSVGGIRFCRPGVLGPDDWPPLTRPNYDREHSEAIRAKGFKVGYYKHLTCLHIGEGYSERWK